jgi:chemotaxis protein methyltransferase CheR
MTVAVWGPLDPGLTVGVAVTHVREDAAVSTVEDWVCSHFGLRQKNDRFEHVVSAIRYQAEQAGCADLSEYLLRLDQEPGLYARLVEHLSVQESYFFRVPDQFAFIRDRVLPDFVARQGPFASLRVWSAGCASGEEVYSLAILLHEARLLDRASLLATDVSDAALAKALGGLYRPWSFRSEERWPVRQRYFTAVADGYLAVDPSLRRRITFRRHNLLRSTYPDTASGICDLDLVLCRNVLIYFSRERAQQLVQQLQRCLAPGGWLITGPSDPLAPAVLGCETLVTAAGVLYRRKAPAETGHTETLPVNTAKTDAAQAHEPAPVHLGRGRAFEGHREGMVATAVSALAGGAPRRVPGPEGAKKEAVHSSRAGEQNPADYFDQGLQAVATGSLDAAVTAFRKALYLDDSLIIVQLNMAAVLERQGRREAARRACQHAYRLAASQPADALIALANDLSAADIMAIARKQIARLAMRRE